MFEAGWRGMDPTHRLVRPIRKLDAVLLCELDLVFVDRLFPQSFIVQLGSSGQPFDDDNVERHEHDFVLGDSLFTQKPQCLA